PAIHRGAPLSSETPQMFPRTRHKNADVRLPLALQLQVRRPDPEIVREFHCTSCFIPFAKTKPVWGRTFLPDDFYTNSFNCCRNVSYALNSSDLVADSLNFKTSAI